MLFRITGSVMVVQQGTEAATEQEWRAFLTTLGQQDLAKLKVLVRTSGGGPTAEQRAKLKIVMGSRSVRTAVVSDSVKVRFMIATVALINREHHGFSVRELGKAYDFLELSLAERSATESALKQLGKLLA